MGIGAGAVLVGLSLSGSRVFVLFYQDIGSRKVRLYPFQPVLNLPGPEGSALNTCLGIGRQGIADSLGKLGHFDPIWLSAIYYVNG